MKIQSLLKKYPEVEASILGQYKEADKVIVYHKGDVDLTEIHLKLPKPPEYHLIEGFGIPAKDQKWSPPKMPKKLLELQEYINPATKEPLTIDELWIELEENQVRYRESIQWIKDQWDKTLNGHWTFINGKPTFIDGWQYFYCGFFNLDIGLADYRSRDWKFFHFARHCFTTTKDQFGKDLGYRVCYGFNYPKHRRDGATYKCLCILYFLTITHKRVLSGIQSMDEESARGYFQDMLVPAWQDMPFFFKPVYAGQSDPRKEMNFRTPATRTAKKGISAKKGTSLTSKINYATTAHRKFYDGNKMMAHLSDEEGKTVLENVDERWAVVKHCIAQGNGAKIHGLSMHPSTVGEMTDQGGEQYYDLCEKSHFGDRNANGQTDSGLFNLFLPADDGLEGFIDEYGDSVIGKPTRQQALFLGKTFGANEYLERQRATYLRKGDPKSMEDYRELCRLFPLEFRECFITEAGGAGFNMHILEQRINDLKKKPETVKGDFEMVTKIHKGKQVLDYVRWVPDPEKGKFDISLVLPEEEANLRFFENETWWPTNPSRFTAAADPFKFNKKTEGKKMSNGGGAVFWDRDKRVDPDQKDVTKWKSNRFVCTYNTRTGDRNEYCQDMLAMCIYYGAMMYPEVNVPVVWDYFEENGYGGYLKYDVDIHTGKQKINPGWTSLEGSKQDLFNLVRDYIEQHGLREQHVEFFEECKKIKGIEQMTKFDLFTACAGALKGKNSSYHQFVEQSEDSVNPEQIWERYEY